MVVGSRGMLVGTLLGAAAHDGVGSKSRVMPLLRYDRGDR